MAALRPAMHRAMRHRHESVVLRNPATAAAFPSQVQVNQAYDYLLGAGSLADARARWSDCHRDVFFPNLPEGHAGVFAAPAAGGSSHATANAASGVPAVRRPVPSRRVPARPNNRSGGERIIVGTWANAMSATANAVVAGFDARGRLFYRIVNEDALGNRTAAPTATATRFEYINFRAAYQNMTADQVRTAVDQHLRLNAFQRP